MSETDDDSERPRLSWSEIDKRRDRPRTRADERPRGAAAEARSGVAAKRYLAKMGEQLFRAEAAGGEAGSLARAVRDAHGTPALPAACQRYLEEAGSPPDVALAVLFLDAQSPALQTAGLEALSTLHTEGTLTPSAGMRSQLRILSESSDDDVAYAAEELLAAL
ncbi:MAG: hypothetical protein ABFS46_07365 [Myxococcota bacterium]